MSAELLTAAVVFDLIFADPRHWPHPIVWIGRLITRGEELLRDRFHDEVLAGLVLVVTVLAVTGFASLVALDLAGRLAAWLQV